MKQVVPICLTKGLTLFSCVFQKVTVRAVDLLTSLVVLSLFLGCSKADNHGASFQFEQLDGAELALLMRLNCAKYVYQGKDRYYFWQLSANLYGPDDELIEKVILGGGGCGLKDGQNFSLLVPVQEEGDAVIRFFGLTTTKRISRLLPESDSAFASSWNSEVPLKEGEPLILGLFAVDLQDSLTFPNLTLPKGLGGYLLAVTLELQESEPGRTNPFN